MNAKESRSEIPKVVVNRFIPASRERVFAAWTKPEQMEKWFQGFKGGYSVISNNLRVGGSYTNDMYTNGVKSGCTPGETQTKYEHTGEYLEISPPERLVFTWNSGSVKNTRVTIQLKEA